MLLGLNRQRIRKNANMAFKGFLWFLKLARSVTQGPFNATYGYIGPFKGLCKGLPAARMLSANASQKSTEKYIENIRLHRTTLPEHPVKKGLANII